MASNREPHRGHRRACRDSVAAAVTLAMTLAMTLPAHAHLGGEIVRPVFTAPAADIVIIDPNAGPVTVAWTDPDEDPTGQLEFFITPDNIPPAAELSKNYFAQGAPIGSAQVSDPQDGFDWDASGLAPGVYTLFALSIDPPLCDVATPSPTTLVVLDPSPGAPLPLAGRWTAPDHTSNTSIAGKTNLTMVALSASVPSMTLELGRIVPAVEGPEEDPCRVVGVFEASEIIAADVDGTPDVGAGENRWALRYFWDPAGQLPGRYVVRATLTNAQGQTHTLYTPVELPLSTLPMGPDSGPEASVEAGADLGNDLADAPEVLSDDSSGGSDELAPSQREPEEVQSGCAAAASADRVPAVDWLLAICLIAGLGVAMRRRAFDAR